MGKCELWKKEVTRRISSRKPGETERKVSKSQTLFDMRLRPLRFSTTGNRKLEIINITENSRCHVDLIGRN